VYAPSQHRRSRITNTGHENRGDLAVSRSRDDRGQDRVLPAPVAQLHSVLDKEIWSRRYGGHPSRRVTGHVPGPDELD